MAEPIQRLQLFETRVLYPLATRGPGTYEQPMHVEGNSLLSSIYVQSSDPGASVTLTYFDTTTGKDTGEEYFLNAHPPMIGATNTTNRLLVAGLHNKPVARIVVTGGNVQFGVYITVVSTIAADIDASLVFDGDTYTVQQKGIVVAGFDEESGLLRFLRVTDKGLKVDIGQSSAGEVISAFIEDEVLGAATETILTYTVPAGKILNLSLIECEGDNIATYRIKKDSVTIAKKSTSFWSDDGLFDFRTGLGIANNGLVFTAGQVVTVDVDNFRPSSAPFSSRLLGVLVDEP